MEQTLTKEQALALMNAGVVSLESDEREAIRAQEAAQDELAQELAWQLEAELQRQSQANNQTKQ
ncbi:hypothetical protein [Helicobacter canis]|uniref:Uncharacterized protein n=1 Tax=Helicobacter canis NCTC 12740 TaxID=1357399 RepID=V8CFU4_9HELI|nr:hypothetical protein [Helicobacter canis]ETD25601.1 hypothetical protein HMPREF2087_01429 [Helicobacter canis NCTC 12740]